MGSCNILKFCNVEIDEENLLSLLIGDLLTMIYSKNSIYPIIDSPFNTFALFYVEKRLFLSDDFLTVVAVAATFVVVGIVVGLQLCPSTLLLSISRAMADG